MSIYETVLVLKPTLSDPEVTDLAEKTRGAITKESGEILSHEIWGRRKLVHLIGKAREGIYVHFKFKTGAAVIKKLTHQFSLNTNIMRQMTVMAKERKIVDKKPAKAAPAAAAAQPVS